VNVAALRDAVEHQVHGANADIPIADLGSPSLVAAIAGLFPTGSLALSGADGRDLAIVDTPDKSGFEIDGVGRAAPFTGMAVKVRFAVDEGDVVLRVDGDAAPDWSLATAFATLADTIVGEARFDRATLSFAHGGGPSGMSLAATLRSASVLGSLEFLVGRAPTTVAGPIVPAGAGVAFVLGAAAGPAVDVGFLALHGVALSLNAVFEDDLQTAFVELATAITVTRTDSPPLVVPLRTAIYEVGCPTTFEADVGDAAAGLLEEFAALVGGGSAISETLAKTTVGLSDNVRLTTLLLQLDPAQLKHIKFVTLGVASTRDWSLVPGSTSLVIRNVQVTFRVNEPQGERVVNLRAAGDLSVAGAVIELAAEYPDFSFYGALQEGSKLALPAMTEFIAGRAVDVPNLAIGDLDFYVSPTGGYGTEIAISGSWEVPVVGILAVDEVGFAIDHAESTTVGAWGVLVVAGIGVEVEITHAGHGAGWDLTGKTRDDQPLAVGDLLLDVADWFGITSLPAPLNGLELHDVSVEFNTETTDFTLNAGVRFPIAGKPYDLVLRIAATHEEDAYKRECDGTLTIGTTNPMKFDVAFEGTDDEASLKGTWEGGDVHLSDLLTALGVGDVLPAGSGLDFSITKAELVYDSKEDSQAIVLRVDAAGATIVVASDNHGGTRGTGLAVALDSSVSLSGIPIVKEVLPAGETASFGAVAVTLTSSALTGDAAGRLNALIKTDPQRPLLAEGIFGGAGLLTGKLDLGGNVTPFRVPLGDKKKLEVLTPEIVRGSLAVEAADGDSTKWVDVQRGFGPVWFKRVGLSYASGELGFALDTSLSLAAVKFSLNGLRASSPLTAFAPHFDLDGLGLAFESGGLTIAGEFLKSKDAAGNTEYAGSAVVKAKAFAVSGLGAYTVVDGAPSVFVFVVLDAALGGPSFFFVTGLAAGFGYNRELRIPNVEDVPKFPLIKAAIDPSSIGKAPKDGLARMKESLGTRIGSYWVAAGVKFKSFEMIDSFALISVVFGNELQIALLGVSKIRQPVKGDPLMYAELALRVVVLPSDGVVQAEARLTGNSYVLDPKCRLTGGFAFYAWFAGEHAGDFCVTLGGYHPAYKRPDHYPVVPRLAFNWPMGDIVIKGEAYFALTPSCVMAGGALSAVYESGGLRAWFNAQADFLISWQPFFYDVRIGVRVGASYTFTFICRITLSVELSATVHLSGPPLKGQVTVHWSVISFTVAFGAGNDPSPATLTWAEFEAAFLPKPPAGANAAQAVCGVTVATGLLREVTDPQGDVAVVRASELMLTVRTAVPATKIVGVGSDRTDATGVCIGPMGDVLVTSTLAIAVKDKAGRAVDLGRGWQAEPVTDGAPSALWAAAPPRGNQPPDPSTEVLPGKHVGLGLAPPSTNVPSPRTVALAALAFTDLDQAMLPFGQQPPPYDGGAAPPSGNGWDEVGRIRQTAIAKARDAVLAAASACFSAAPAIDLSRTEAAVRLAFPDEPRVGPVGGSDVGSSRTQLAASPAPLVHSVVPRASAGRPRLVFAVRRHHHGDHVTGRSVSAHAATARHHVRGVDAAIGRRTRRKQAAAMALTPGQTVVWDVDATRRQAVKNDGELSVRVLAFDHHNALLEDGAMPAGDPGTRVLPDGAVRVALIVDEQGATQRGRHGWDATSLLTAVNPVALVGDGCVVRPQAAMRVSAGGREVGHGLLSGRAVSVGNRIATPDGQVGGGADTTLPRGTRSVAVLLAREGDPTPVAGDDGADVSMFVNDGIVPLTAAGPVPGADDGSFFYELLPSEAVEVRVRPRPGWVVTGVVGLDVPAVDAAGAWTEPRLVADADEPRDGGTVGETRLELVLA